MSWVSKEFSGLELGDKRLTNRVCNLAKAIYECPMHSIGTATGTWKDTKAAYRLFDNPKVNTDKILAFHAKQSFKRAKHFETVLAIQDTSYLNLADYENREELGFLNEVSNGSNGLILHTTLLSTTSGMPLGIIDQEVLKRKYINTKKNNGRLYQLPAEEKEGYRWIKSAQSVIANMPTSSRVVMVADREADKFELLLFHSDMSADYLVRSKYNRVVGQRQTDTAKHEYLEDIFERLPVKGKYQITVHDKKTKKERTAFLEVKFTEVYLPAPKNFKSVNGPSTIKAHAIEVKENHPPPKCSAIHWKLLTSMEINTLSAAIEKVNWYKARWTIEVFHKVLKSGCRVEATRLATFDRLKRFITLNSIVAWRLLWLTRMQKQNPEQPCSSVFAKSEWKTLFFMVDGKKPRSAPTLNEALRKMAGLGGFLGRKTDGNPGIQTIWLGWNKLNLMAKTSRKMKTYG